MERRGKAIDRYGRVWKGVLVRKPEAGAEDFNFWFESLTPEKRVAAVGECLETALKAKGRNVPSRPIETTKT